MMIPCIECGKKAKWSYMPGAENFCDNCVPRGCSCNRDEDGKEKLDAQGRPYPCCEYFEISEDFHNDKDIVESGWEDYFQYHPEQRRESEDVEYWEEKLLK